MERAVSLLPAIAFGMALAAWAIAGVAVQGTIERARVRALFAALWWSVFVALLVIVLAQCTPARSSCPRMLAMQDPACENGIVVWQLRGDSLYPPPWTKPDTIHACTYTYRAGVPHYSPGSWASAPGFPPVVEDSAACARLSPALSIGG